MMRLWFRRGVLRMGLLGLLVASVMLLVLVGSSAAVASRTCSTASATTTCTYESTGVEQSCTVPAGVTSVHVVARGGRGGLSGGAGAQVAGDFTITPGETLYVEVGGNAQLGAGGYNGGGAGNGPGGGGGGGASD